MTIRTCGLCNQVARSSLVAIALISVAGAQSQPNPPTGLSIDGGTTLPGSPTTRWPFFDDFDYVVDKFDSRDEKFSAFTTRGYNGVKDQTTRDGANGYIYTRTTAPGCGASPAGGRMLTLEALPTTLGHQTDFYLELGRGTAGDIPARLYVQAYICMSRSGSEMSDVRTSHNKLFYPLFGSRSSYPIATDDVAWLQTMSDSQFRGTSQIPAPETGAFTFRNVASASDFGNRAFIASQMGTGTEWMMTPNVGDPWIRPNRWYKVRMLYDVSGTQGIHRIWIGQAGQPLTLIADFTGGVTPGFTYATTALDRLGAKFLRFPTTVGPGSGTPGPDYWLNMDNLRLAGSEQELD